MIAARWTIPGAVLAAVLAGCAGGAPPGAAGSAPVIGLRSERLAFDDLDGWAGDDQAAALAVFVRSCPEALKRHDEPLALARLCADARQVGREGARLFIEDRFRPLLLTDGREPLFTGYYEPELMASRSPDQVYRYPLYAAPEDLERDPTGAPARRLAEGAWGPYYTREQIEAGALEGRGLELFWLADPVEVYFLQVQGSGRLTLTDGTSVRLGFAAKNGQEYRSIGAILAAQGVMPAEQASAQAIKAYVRANPARGRELLNQNPSFVFFRELGDLDPGLGPLGALEVQLTPLRSIAVDPEFYGLGALIWVETESALGKLRRTMVAQDVGSAIQGPQRGDIFFGSGDAAGETAGRMKYSGRMVVLVPVEVADRLARAG